MSPKTATSKKLASPEARPSKYSFVIRGQSLSLSREQVIQKLKSVKPGVYKEHIVEIAGVWHPLKKAFAIVSGLDLLKFQTAQALAVFEKLGFKVDRMSNREK